MQNFGRNAKIDMDFPKTNQIKTLAPAYWHAQGLIICERRESEARIS